MTDGWASVGSGTLYNLLEQFLDAGMIRETKAEGRRRSYILTDKGREALENDPPVDLAVLTEQDISDVRNMDYKHSVLFTRYTMTLQSISVGDADFWLTYTATKPGIPFLSKWCKEQLLDRYATWRLRDKQGEFRQIESGFGNDAEVWVFYDEDGTAHNHYLLCYNDHIVELFPGWTLNQQQMQLLGAMLRAA